MDSKRVPQQYFPPCLYRSTKIRSKDQSSYLKTNKAVRSKGDLSILSWTSIKILGKSTWIYIQWSELPPEWTLHLLDIWILSVWMKDSPNSCQMRRVDYFYSLANVWHSFFFPSVQYIVFLQLLKKKKKNFIEEFELISSLPAFSRNSSKSSSLGQYWWHSYRRNACQQLCLRFAWPLQDRRVQNKIPFSFCIFNIQ